MTTHGDGPVLVTGASTGIGLAITRRLAARGIPVLAGVRKQVDADRLAEIAGVEPLILDVTSADDIARLREHLAGKPLAGLVNNAGVGMGGPLEELDSSVWRAQFDVNVFGAIDVTRATLDSIRTGHGRIVNIGSIGGRIGQPFMGPYSGSKGALRLISASLRRELRPWKIWVAIVEPSAMATEIWRKAEETADDVTAGISAAGIERYGRQIARLPEVVAGQSKAAEPPDRVAEAVEHALSAKRPRPTYLVGRDARISNALSAILPARAMDALIARVMGI